VAVPANKVEKNEDFQQSNFASDAESVPSQIIGSLAITLGHFPVFGEGSVNAAICLN